MKIAWMMPKLMQYSNDCEYKNFIGSRSGGRLEHVFMSWSWWFFFWVVLKHANLISYQLSYALKFKFTADYLPAPIRTGNLISTPRKVK